jgi:predicted permease
MLLARAPARRQELSVRAALGAGRSRLARQLLSETLALSAGGGILGVVLAFWFQRVVLDFLQMDRLGVREGGVSPSMLLFAMAVSLGAGLLTGLYPAVRSARGNLAQDLKDGARNPGVGGTGFRSSLVVAQVALSIVLLVGAGLLIRSLTGMGAVHPGFDARNLLTFDIELPDSRYPDGVARAGFYTDLLLGLEALPGVGSVAMTSNLPIRHFGNIFRASIPGEEGEGLRVFLRGIQPGYFAAMGIPVLMGSELREEDGTATISLIDAMDVGDQTSPDASRVAVISESMARSSFPNENPLGRQLDLDFFGTPRRVEVVGVVGDVRLTGLELDPESAIYLPYRQFATRRLGIALRTEAPLSAMAGAIRDAVWRLDRDIPVVGLSTLERDMADSVADRRIVALALSLYALLPLLLAGVGLYAVVAYYVAQRAHEIGVRMALGADPRQVGMLILRRGTVLTAFGIATGLIAALGLTRFLRGVLFGVEPTDPGTFLAVTAFVLLVALAACVVPTWRAVRSDPRVALRAS